MKEFTSIDSLLSEIQSDKHTPYLPSSQRYPVRLIFLPHLWMLKGLVNALGRLQVKKAELTDFLPHDDGWLTVGGIIKVIKELNPGQDYIVIPFSEIVRFYTDDNFRTVLNRLTIEFENTGNIRPNRRLYFPLVGIYDRFERVFWHSFHRKTEWAPLWRLIGEDQKITLYLLDHQLPTPATMSPIQHTREWLNLWKKGETGMVICYSKILSSLHKNTFPDYAFDLKKTVNSKELISALYEISIPIVYETEEKDYWDAFWTTLQDKRFSDFDDIVKQVFNRRKIEKNEIIDLWVEKPEQFHRWLLKWYVLSRHDWRKTYIVHVLKNIENFEDHELVQTLWFNIFDHDSYKNTWIQERREQLRILFEHLGTKVSHVEGELQRILSQKVPVPQTKAISSSDLWKKAELFTGITMYERKLTVELSKEVESSETKFLTLLQEIYPHLACYLADVAIDDLKNDSRWVEEYFREYRWSKVRHSESERLKQILSEQNKNKDTFYRWYYAFSSVQSHSLFQETEVDKVIWIDGLGIEWLPLLTKLIEDQGLIVEKKSLARANLPSVTTCNRFENAQRIMKLDKFIHDQNQYKYPDDLICEIEIIAEVVKEYLSTGEKILIVSDHGFTAFATKEFENRKKYDFAESDHEGRCLWTETEFLDDEDFFVHIPEHTSGRTDKKCVIPLRRSSLHNVPRREVHGGATPEEVLVPLLLISKGMKVEEKELSYTIDPVHQEISFRNPIISFSIKPEPGLEPKLRYKRDKILELRYSEQEKKWQTDLKDFQAGQYKFDIELGDWSSQISVTVRGGMKEKDLF